MALVSIYGSIVAHLGNEPGNTALMEYVIVLVPFLQIFDGLPKNPCADSMSL